MRRCINEKCPTITASPTTAAQTKNEWFSHMRKTSAHQRSQTDETRADKYGETTWKRNMLYIFIIRKYFLGWRTHYIASAKKSSARTALLHRQMTHSALQLVYVRATERSNERKRTGTASRNVQKKLFQTSKACSLQSFFLATPPPPPPPPAPVCAERTRRAHKCTFLKQVELQELCCR